MIAITCRRCGSTQLRKNGRTASGQQKVHCKTCTFYGTRDTKDEQRHQQRKMVEKLHLERLSQRTRSTYSFHTLFPNKLSVWSIRS